MRSVLFLSLPMLLLGLNNQASAYVVGDSLDAALLAKLNIDSNKITVIDFFAEWCASCRKELPLISAVHGRVDKANIDFIGIDTDDDVKVAERFQQELRAKGALSFRTINDAQQTLVNQFKPKGYPALYLIKDGKIVGQHIGAVANVDKVLTADLKKLGVN